MVVLARGNLQVWGNLFIIKTPNDNNPCRDIKMKAQLKQILETQNFGDLKDYQPDNPNYFSVGISMLIGELGQDWAEIFYAQICSFDWFYDLKGQQKTFHTRDMIVVEHYDYQSIKNHLNRIISMYDEENWQSLANQLNKYFIWEFDDYQE